MSEIKSNYMKKAGALKAQQCKACPLWYHNFKANPEGEIQDGPSVIPMTVEEIENPMERKRLWDLSVEAYPPYDEYQQKTDRLIPVFLATPN